MPSNGQSKSDMLKQLLRAQGVSESQFIQSIRQELGNTLYRSALIGGATKMSFEEASDLYQFQNEKRDFKGVVLDNSFAKTIAEPTDENLKKFYEANKSDFAIPETRSVTIATLKKEMLADKVEISEDELKDIYAENIETYTKPERRRVEQAVFTEQANAQAVHKKVTEGTDLKNAVKAVTNETAPYLGENNFEQNGLLEEISEPVFAAEKGDVLEPVQTALGWHVLIIKDVIQPQVESFESVRANLKDNLVQERLLDDLVNTANTLDDQLAGGEQLEVVVKELGLTTEQIKDFNQAGISSNGQDLFKSYQGDKAQILEAAFDFQEGESSPVLELADGRFITVRVDAVKPLEYQPYESVEAKLKTRWLDQQKQLANRVRAEEAFKMLADGASLDDVAKKYGARVQTFTKLERASAPKAPLTLPALRDIFEAKQNENLQLTLADGFVIGQVGESTLPSIDQAKKEIEEIREQTAQLLPQEILLQYINALSLKYDVKVNERILRTVYGAPAES
jgi:peptidyl-prolyl cis-trans isomerase D